MSDFSNTKNSLDFGALLKLFQQMVRNKYPHIMKQRQVTRYINTGRQKEKEITIFLILTHNI